MENMYKKAMKNMLFGQMIPNRIHDSNVLNAIQIVPREVFLPDFLKNKAYVDEALLIKTNAFLFSPEIFAKLLLLAKVKNTDFVLNLNATTGYSAAVLSFLSKAVVALETDSAMFEMAEKNIIDLKLDNVAVFHSDSEVDFSNQPAFDVIFIDGVVSKISDKILNQLSEGGRLICVLRDSSDFVGKVTKVVKNKSYYSYTTEFEVDLFKLLSHHLVEKFEFETIS